MTIYAQLNSENIVFAVTESDSAPVGNFVVSESFDVIGHALVNGVLIEQPAPTYTWSSPDLPEQYWWVYPGAFKDRFANDYAAIAASDHPVCRAFIALTADRLYIDLNGQVGQLFDALIAAGQPATNAFIPLASPMTIEKKAVILAPPTTDYERFVKGLPDPVEE